MKDQGLTILTKDDLLRKRLELFKKQKGICPVCNREIPFNKSVLDHQHKLLKTDTIGENGVGLIRGVLCSQCNVWEGKIFNSFRRYGLHKFEISIPILLRNLANYLERDNLPFIHPKEIKKKVLSKSKYNKLKKAYSKQNNKKKFPEYPKSKKITKSLSVLFEDFNINPYNKND
jgi:hypothetical protein